MSERMLRECVEASLDRYELWGRFIRLVTAAQVAEIGVYRGEFAARLLADCRCISRYYMVDPWRHLGNWNKPANTADDVFERYFEEAMGRTLSYQEKLVVLRGTTTEVIDQVPDGTLDFAYVDGDHTLRGITTDLLRVFPKIRDDGWIGGDDFCPSIWQHHSMYEPTLVFPYTLYFAEAVGARLYALPYNQFLIDKSRMGGHEFIDLTGNYGERSLRAQLVAAPPWRRTSPRIGRYLRSTVRSFASRWSSNRQS